MSETIFVNGLNFKKRRAGAPDFVKGHISINVSNFKRWIARYGTGEWLNIDLKESKKGKLYFQLNTWKPKKKAEEPETDEEPEINIDNIPF